jgi:hypothetical protein
MQRAALPVPMQVPALHVRLAQQISFTSPHAWQLRAVPPSAGVVQRKVSLQVPLPPTVVAPQQASFSPPQAWHIRPPSLPATGAQSLPGWQESPGQQAPPLAPQFMQVALLVPGLAQPRPVLQVSPPQQAAPAVPHG